MNDKIKVLVKLFISIIPLPLLRRWVDWANRPPLKAVEELDLERYSGKWYQVAYVPNWFQSRCVSGTTATYTLREDGKFDVVNQCCTKSGITISTKGVAQKVRGSEAIFKVSFMPSLFSLLPFTRANYWVLQLDPQYQYAVIGEPSRSYLWILSRTPHMDDRLYDKLIEDIAQQGYKTDKIVRTPAEVPAAAAS